MSEAIEKPVDTDADALNATKTPIRRMLASPKSEEDIELRPDDWERFRQAVHAAAKSGPKHKVTPKAKERPASNGRVHNARALSEHGDSF